jgi:hypothetical protein
MILLTNLPVDSSNFYAPHYNALMNDETYEHEDSTKPQRGWWKKELDRIRGRGNRPREQVSVEDFVSDATNKKKRVR